MNVQPLLTDLLDETDQWLLRLIRTYFGRSKSAPDLPVTGNWEQLYRKSRTHRISPLLYEILKTWPSDDCPDSVLAKFKKDFLQNGAINTIRMHGLTQLVTLLHQHDIPVILLKGACYLETVYENNALRTMDDLDILVPGEKLHETVSILVDHEYCFASIAFSGQKPPVKNQPYYVASGAKHFPALLSPDGRLRLDIHCALTPNHFSIRMNTADLWTRAIRIHDDMMSLCLEDMIIYHCYHTSIAHCFRGGLRDFVDLALLIKPQNNIQWQSVTQNARLWGAEKCVSLVFVMMDDLFKIEQPMHPISNLIVKPQEKAIQIQATQILFSDFQATHGFSKDFIHLWGKSTVLHKIRSLRSILFPAKEVMTLMYPVGTNTLKTLLYYPVRLRDLFRRYGRAIAMMLIGNRKIVEPVHHINQLEQWLTDQT
jgi:hypothetical protein